jgi:lipid II:glycine glycyltransferase (peptidoglycan interpeptide bridge formation enzyme)
MSSLPVVNPTDKTWDDFVAGHRQGHLLQMTPWGELKSQFGWSVERVALLAPSGTIVAGAQILCRRLPFGLGKLAYVPRGPVLDWQNAASTQQLIAALDQVARARGALAVTIEPDLPFTPENSARVAQAGFVPGTVTVQPRRTLLVDITVNEDQILAAMKSKTRYNIRLAARKGVTVRQGTSADVEIFNDLMAVTGDRNDFSVRNPEYYRAAFDFFDQTGWVGLFLAEYQGEPLAGLMAYALGNTAWYFFGASSDAHRNLMAPYAVQWAAMRWAKAKGCQVYDLWGVPDEEETTLESRFTQRQDGLWGVYRFKRGFGGRLTRTIGPWDRIRSPLRYRLFQWALWSRNLGGQRPD